LGNYDRGIISGLNGKKHNLNKYFNKLLEAEDERGYFEDLKKHTQELKDIANNTDDFIQKIKQIIIETRKLKKLDEMEIII